MVRAAGSEEPVNGRAVFKRAKLTCNWSANSHTGAQPRCCSTRPGQIPASDYVQTCPDLLLASEGAVTDAGPRSRVCPRFSAATNVLRAPPACPYLPA